MIQRLSTFIPLLMLLFACRDVGGQPLQFDPIAEVLVRGRPESVIGDAGFLYASNLGVGANPLAKDGNGYISKISYDGVLLEQQLIAMPGQLDGPTGMALLGDRLFVADLDEVFGFDLQGQAAPLRINLSQFGVSFLNDLVAVSDHELVVSGTNVRKLFLVDTTAQSASEIQLDFVLSAPNGLAFDPQSGELYVAANLQHQIGANNSNGEVLKLDLDIAAASAAFSDRLSGAGRFLDGIALFGADQLIYSDWVTNGGPDGVLGRLNISDMSPATSTQLNLAGFADFHWQANRRLLVAPDLVNGRVQLLRLAVPEPSTIVGLLFAAMTLALSLVCRPAH